MGGNANLAYMGSNEACPWTGNGMRTEGRMRLATLSWGRRCRWNRDRRSRPFGSLI